MYFQRLEDLRVDAPLNIKLVKLTIMARKVCEKCDIDGNSVDII